MPGPLAQVRVVDLSAVVAGPLTTVLLADQGADVIKIERPDRGDIQRAVGSRRGGMSGNFHVLNRGKRSLALDIRTPEGRDVVHRLVDDADVVVQNYRPGVMDRLGLGWTDLERRNPRLVYLSISGFGADGPDRDRPAYDPIIQARSGLASVQGRARGETPEQVHQLLADKITAFTGAQAVTAALLARQHSGRGQHIELAMLDAMIAFLWPDAGADRILVGDGIEEHPPIGGAGRLHRFADGWATTMALSDADFEGFCRVFGVDDLARDPRFGELAGRQRHRDALKQVLDERLAPIALGMTVAEAEARFDGENVPFGRVRDFESLADDEQIRSRGVFVERDHPIAGPLREAVPAARFAGTPAAPGRPAPALGEHTREILQSIGLGDRFEEWSARGIVTEPVRE